MKGIFKKLYSDYPERFSHKPPEEIRKRIYDRAYINCYRAFKKAHGRKPNIKEIRECIEDKIIDLLENYQTYKTYKVKRKRKKEDAWGLEDIRGHTEDCMCPKCNPEFEPFDDEWVERELARETPEEKELKKKLKEEIEASGRTEYYGGE